MRETVLIADSDRLLCAAYEVYLISEGFDVIVANNGVDCLAMLRLHAPDAMILDAELPWGSGAGIMQVMAEDGDVPDVPVVLLTVLVGPIPQLPASVQASATLLKPVAPAAVAQTMRDLMESGRVFCSVAQSE